MSEVIDVPTPTAGAPDEVDPATLTEVLDGAWGQARRWARTFEPQRFDTRSYELDTEAHRARVTARLAEFAATGMPQSGFPAIAGGAGDVGGGMVVIEMLGYRDLSLMVKAGVQWGLFAGAIAALGTERHHREHLRRAVELDLMGCFAMTEAGHGSDVQSLETTATYDPQSQTFDIHSPTPSARKTYIGNAARDGQLAVVFAQLRTPDGDHGVHALLVPIRTADGRPAPGVTIADCGRKAGLNGVDNGQLVFDHVTVPREALLDRYGHVAPDGTYSSPIESKGRRFFTMLGTLVRGRVTIGGAAQNAAKHALVIAVRHGLRRRQFPGPDGGEEVLLLDYRAHQRRLLPALATSYALSFAQDQLVTTLHELMTADEVDPRAQRELESRAAGLKAVSTWHTTATVQACREACGGAGYMAENSLPLLKADTDVFTTFEGDNTVLLQLVGKGLLTDYSAQFEDLDWRQMARFAADNAVNAAIERTVPRGVFTRLRRGDEGVHNRVWQLTLLEDREKHLVETVAARLRRGRASRGSFAAFNDVQPHLLDAARAHVDRIVLEAFLAAIDGCERPEVRRLLEKVCDLHVLSQIERDRGWYLEHNRISPGRSKEVTRAVDELCEELRRSAGTLVAGFGIPETWIDAEIARA
ncbi:acyl-CoA oxidase [Auraticoccus sp. F435]|uniref:acyl-CoA oxidase n=1 Tax=Auraticoccus cholistanensis TaxID=2656650 RepID=A0A6A9UV55_9ACTN|nr:acyl-CoA dehydrogenase [Auraticoccus cholistanensis]MVA76571.1 acyl-CoA oxidase [Auraticoccus cholistanensis]